MRYELDGNLYISKVFFGCMSGLCEEYTGTVPEGYTTLEDWATNANIRAYKIVDGNLVYDADRDAELQAEWANDWKRAELTDYFAPYQNEIGNTPEYKKDGQTVEIRGVVSPTLKIGGSADRYTIFILPEGYRPTKAVPCVCQGSSKNTWLLSVQTDGLVTFARYGTTEYTNATTTSWLPFHLRFLID